MYNIDSNNFITKDRKGFYGEIRLKHHKIPYVWIPPPPTLHSYFNEELLTFISKTLKEKNAGFM
jgi:hypothetical protein